MRAIKALCGAPNTARTANPIDARQKRIPLFTGELHIYTLVTKASYERHLEGTKMQLAAMIGVTWIACNAFVLLAAARRGRGMMRDKSLAS